MKLKHHFSVLTLLGVLLLASATTAHAQSTATIPQGDSISYIGMAWLNGVYRSVVSSTNLYTGSCQTITIGGNGSTPAQTGLTANTQLNGTTTGDWIVFVRPGESTPSCGLTVDALIFNGRRLTVNAGNGSDEFDGGNNGLVTLGGDAGNDFVSTSGSGHRLYGYTGTDTLRGGSLTEQRGESGNDYHCVWPGENASLLNGGGTFFETNTRCGTANSYTAINGSTNNCGPCFF